MRQAEILRSVCFFLLYNLANFGVLDCKIIGGCHLSTNNDCSTPPPNFPTSIQLEQTKFENWAEDIIVRNLWTATPASAQDVVTLANWAYEHGYQIRASGYMHTWSPITVTKASPCNNILLVKTGAHLTNMQMTIGPPAAVTAQTGVSMVALLTFLEGEGYGVVATPAPGDLSLGGVLAIDGHGTAVPAAGEQQVPSSTYGSISNLVTSFEAVVWDSTNSIYALRTFDRSETDAKAFLTSLGRAFLTKATLRVAPNNKLRCVSQLNIPASELFADPSVAPPGSRTFASFLDSTGRVETIQFAFTANPWLKVWSVSPRKPLLSRSVKTPYNYPFSDNLPVQVSDLVSRLISGEWEIAPLFGQTMYDTAAAGLLATASSDIWGPSKNLLLYVKPTTLRVTANGYAVITARSNVQNIVSKVVSFYKELESEYRSRGEYPVNGPVEIRATGLDQPADVGIDGAVAPALSALRPIEAHPELDTAVWFDILSIPQTPLLSTFLTEIESYMLGNIHDGVTAIVRPEWSKGWAYTSDATWTNQTVLAETIPSRFKSSTNSADDGWDWVVATLNGYDPNHVFSNGFLDSFLV